METGIGSATEGRRKERSPAPHGVQGEASKHILLPLPSYAKASDGEPLDIGKWNYFLDRGG